MHLHISFFKGEALRVNQILTSEMGLSRINISKTERNDNWWPGRKKKNVSKQTPDLKRQRKKKTVSKGKCHLYLSSFKGLHYCFKIMLNYAQCLPSNMHERTVFIPPKMEVPQQLPVCCSELSSHMELQAQSLLIKAILPRVVHICPMS